MERIASVFGIEPLTDYEIGLGTPRAAVVTGWSRERAFPIAVSFFDPIWLGSWERSGRWSGERPPLELGDLRVCRLKLGVLFGDLARPLTLGSFTFFSQLNQPRVSYFFLVA